MFVDCDGGVNNSIVLFVGGVGSWCGMSNVLEARYGAGVGLGERDVRFKSVRNFQSGERFTHDVFDLVHGWCCGLGN